MTLEIDLIYPIVFSFNGIKQFVFKLVADVSSRKARLPVPEIEVSTVVLSNYSEL